MGVLGIIGGTIKTLTGINSQKDREKEMSQAWDYEKKGMALQYQYGQQAADAAQARNQAMWDYTNAENQRKHLENAGLSVGLMYGKGGSQAASTAGGTATQPNAPTTNPLSIGLQSKQIDLQNRAIGSQIALNIANAAKAAAEAKKTGGVDTKKAEGEIKWQEIENRIQQSREQIASSNIIEAKATAQKAMEEWNQAVLNTEYLDETQQQRVQTVTEQLSLIQKQGLKEEAIIDLTNAQATKIRKEIDILWYDAITRRESADALKKQADAAIDKIAKDYELGKGHLDLDEQKSLREWIYGGIDQITDIVNVLGKVKNGAETLKILAKKYGK